MAFYVCDGDHMEPIRALSEDHRIGEAPGSVASGAAAGLVSRPGREGPRVFAGLLLLFFLPVHYSLWTKFPLWYHAVFLLSLVPCVLWGSTWGRRGDAVRGPATATVGRHAP